MLQCWYFQYCNIIILVIPVSRPAASYYPFIFCWSVFIACPPRSGSLLKLDPWLPRPLLKLAPILFGPPQKLPPSPHFQVHTRIFTHFPFRSTPQALVSFKKYMPPTLPYFKVNICPFPLPHFASIFLAYLRSFRWPNYIVTLPRYFSLRLPHLNIPTEPPQTNWTRIFSERSLFYF